jgi:hypothetical protein
MDHSDTDTCTVSERAKLHAPCCGSCAIIGALSAVLAGASCARAPVAPVYDADTKTVVRLDYHADGDGDGRIDRWEYYRADGQLDRLGTSSQADGREDTWVVQNGSQMRVDVSTRRDGVADRHEFHQQGVLVRAEQDTDFDGRVDQWQEFEGGKLRRLLIDTERSGRPDRRLVYAASGALERIEADVDGSGTFAPLSSGDSANARP